MLETNAAGLSGVRPTDLPSNHVIHIHRSSGGGSGSTKPFVNFRQYELIAYCAAFDLNWVPFSEIIRWNLKQNPDPIDNNSVIILSTKMETIDKKATEREKNRTKEKTTMTKTIINCAARSWHSATGRCVRYIKCLFFDDISMSLL